MSFFYLRIRSVLNMTDGGYITIRIGKGSESTSRSMRIVIVDKNLPRVFEQNWAFGAEP